MDLSIVIPLLDEAASLPELQDWLGRVLSQMKVDYEIIYVDDGSTDDSWKIIEGFSCFTVSSRVRGIKFQSNYGKSQALHAGFKMARGKVVITMDADLQDSPDEIPALYDMIAQENYDLVSGWKKKRYDSVISKNLPSKLFNWAARRTSGLQLNDFNCGLKAYSHNVVKNIEVTGEMHRYIPVLAVNAGFNRIGEKEVQHQARKYGTTKFGYNRFINGFLDLITIAFITKYGKRPMHLFGTLGVIMFMLGLVAAAYIGFIKLYRLHNDLPYRLVTDNPYFYIALTTMVLGTLFFISGFLGELIVRNSAHKENYRIKKVLD
ncbi:MAG: glycosyltransferase family 2 protein [Nonlabens sp.]